MDRHRHYNSSESGQLLLEILIVIAAASIMATLGAQLVLVSMRSSQSSGERSTASGILQETFEGVRSATAKRWTNLSDLTEGTTNYYPGQSAGEWVLMAGTENVALNGITFTRSFTVQNVCRDSASPGSIVGITTSNGSTTICASGSYDASTQRITATVTWSSNGNSVSSQEYLTRWQNKVCTQTIWSSSGGSATTCPPSNYDTKTNIDTSGTTSIQICDGC